MRISDWSSDVCSSDLYQSENVKGGKQLSAAIYSKDAVDTDGSGANPVRLIFRDHPGWGTSSYLVLQAGDFDCYGGCRVKVKVDDAEPKSMSALRPATDEATAMSINDEPGLWRMPDGATPVTVGFRVQARGTPRAGVEIPGVAIGHGQCWELEGIFRYDL